MFEAIARRATRGLHTTLKQKRKIYGSRAFIWYKESLIELCVMKRKEERKKGGGGGGRRSKVSCLFSQLLYELEELLEQLDNRIAQASCL